MINHYHRKINERVSSYERGHVIIACENYKNIIVETASFFYVGNEHKFSRPIVYIDENLEI